MTLSRFAQMHVHVDQSRSDDQLFRLDYFRLSNTIAVDPVSPGRAIFGGHTFLYYLLQAATTLILVLAANTAYADFPRLASIVSRDGYLPRQFMNQGDRLAFSNGIIVLALFAIALVAIDNQYFTAVAVATFRRAEARFTCWHPSS